MRVQVAPPKPGFITAVADSAMSAGRLVRFSTPGHVEYFDATDTSHWGIQVLGFTRTAVDSGATVEVATAHGEIYLQDWGLTPNALYYASSAGNIITTPPTSGLLIQVGVALDAAHLHFHPNAPIVLNPGV